jgi:hypothetical protein
MGWKYHDMGVLAKEPIPGERYIPHLKLYVKVPIVIGMIQVCME